MKKKVSASSTERNGPNIFHPDLYVGWDRLGAEDIKEIGAPAGLGLIGAHFNDHFRVSVSMFARLA